MNSFKVSDKYKNYDNNNLIWNTIFQEIDDLKNQCNTKFITNVALKYNINPKSLSKKYKSYKEIKNINDKIIINNYATVNLFNNSDNVINNDSKYMDEEPKNVHNHNDNINKIQLYKENRGGHNKALTYEQEKILFDHINEKYISKDLFFDDYCLKISAVKKWNELYPDKLNEFKASNGWLFSYKKRWRLTTLRARYMKVSKKLTETSIGIFLNQCESLSKGLDRNHIFNMDETFWHTIFANRTSLSITGSENRTIKTNFNPKSGFTVIFLISAAGIFHKPVVIVKGKTKRCLKKINVIDDDKIHKKYSYSGWINNFIMLFILDMVYEITKGKSSVLILDKYPVHMNEIISKKAEQYNIKLIYVPEGGTSKYQPLDVSINGIMKSIGKKLLKDKYVEELDAENQTLDSALKDPLDALIIAKSKIKSTVIRNAFKKACNILPL